MKVNERILAAQQIRPYQGPEWLVERIGDALDPEDVTDLSTSAYQVVDRNVLGWGRYNAIIRVDGPDQRALDTYYLAIIVE